MNVFELSAKINLDSKQFKNDLDGVKRSLNTITGPVKSGLSTLGKAAGVAVGAAAAGITAVTKQAVDAYGTFEQLEGGTKLMFGDAYDFIMDKSSEAYKNVQMSQNDYLTQVNGFAIGLKTALGGDARAAAELADRVLTAEADVVAATGNSQEAVQNAFNGIMKSNFTMLDNLQLGITPTKEGFQTLIDQVNKWNAENGKTTKYTIDNVADCQAALVDYIEMQGLSGYAANEAADTIQGSLARTKGAWADLIAGLSKPDADLGLLFDNFVESARLALGNLKPAVERALTSVAQVIKKAAPVISKEIPKIIKATLPSLLKAAVNLVSELIKALPGILKAVGDAIPEILDEIFSAMREIMPKSLLPAFDKLKNAIDKVIQWLKNLDEGQIDTILTIAKVVAAVVGVIMVIQQVISVVSAVSGAIAFLTSPIGLVIVAITALVAAGIYLYKHWDELKEWATKTWETIKATISKIVENIKAKVINTFETIKNTINTILTTAKLIITNIWDAIKAVVSNAVENIKTKITNTFNTIKDTINTILTTAKLIITTIWDAIKSIIATAVDNINTKVTNTFNTVKETINTIFTTVKQIVTSLWDGIKSVISTAVDNIKTNVTNTFNTLKENVNTTFEALKGTVTSLWDGIKSAITTAIDSAKSSVKNAVDTIKTTVDNKFNELKTSVGTVMDSISSKVTEVWDGIKNSITEKITAAKNSVTEIFNSIKSVFDTTLKIKLKVPHVSIDPGEFPWGIGGEGYPPSFSVDWYKKGGIFDNPHLIGIGEAGPEAVLPLDTFWRKLESFMESGVGGGYTLNQYITSPEPLSASEVARQSRNATRQMVLGLKGVA